MLRNTNGFAALCRILFYLSNVLGYIFYCNSELVLWKLRCRRVGAVLHFNISIAHPTSYLRNVFWPSHYVDVCVKRPGHAVG